MKTFIWFAAATLLSFALGWVCGFVDRRPAAPPSEAVQIATAKVEQVAQIAVEAEAIAFESRPMVAKAKEAVEVATETRVNAGFSMEQLPMPVQVEFSAMRELIQTYETQLNLEVSRADAWKEVVEAQRELIEAMTVEHAASLKKARFQSFWKGATGGAMAALLVAVLL